MYDVETCKCMSDFSYLFQQTLLFKFLLITLRPFNKIQQRTSVNYCSYTVHVESTTVIR